MSKDPVTKDQNKAKAIDMALGQIEKQFGKGANMRLGEEGALIPDLPTIPTGSISLDIALGLGGIPRGRVIEIFGPESSGKTTLALHIIAEAQKMGGNAAFIDAEHALDISYARKLGVKTDELLVSQPDNGEQALEISEVLVRSGAVDVLVIDSVAALVPRAEIEGEMGDAHMGLQARLMSQALRKLAAAISKLAEAAKIGEIFVTVTGDIKVIRAEHFRAMKDGAIVCNTGHFNVEIDLGALDKMQKKKRLIRDFVEEFTLPNGRKINILGEGRLINLASAEGHRSSVMDMSFANQALSAEFMLQNSKSLENDVYSVPEDIDQEIARLKLNAMGVKIDKLTPEQKKYLASWEMGT